MSENPVSISAACARAVLAGTKTMLRQVAVAPHEPCPLGAPGDRLWVREPWAADGKGGVLYEGDAVADTLPPDGWQPARSLTRERSRLELEIVAIRLERLSAIAAEDLVAEGSLFAPPVTPDETPHQGFARWWDSLHARTGTRWRDDPWVWVVSFRSVVDRTGPGR